MLLNIKEEVAVDAATETRLDLIAQKSMAAIREHVYEEGLKNRDAELQEKVEYHKKKELYLLRKVQKKNEFILKMQEKLEAEKQRAQEYIQENSKLIFMIDEEVNGGLTYRDRSALTPEEDENCEKDVSFGERFIREEICEEEGSNPDPSDDSYSDGKGSTSSSDQDSDQETVQNQPNVVQIAKNEAVEEYAGMGEDSDLQGIDIVISDKDEIN